MYLKELEDFLLMEKTSVVSTCHKISQSLAQTLFELHAGNAAHGSLSKQNVLIRKDAKVRELKPANKPNAFIVFSISCLDYLHLESTHGSSHSPHRDTLCIVSLPPHQYYFAEYFDK